MANEYKVGDEAELGPVRMNKFLSEVASQGGRVEVKGNVARIVYMPEKPKAKTAVPVAEPKVEEPEPKKAAPRKKVAPKSEDT